MGEHNDILKKALAENDQLKSEKTDSLKKQSTANFRGRIKWAERIVWVYLAGCVLVAVPTLKIFGESRDTKTLITCVLVLLVIYETTVLFKLWFVVASTKLSVLKEVKLLRLEVSQLATSTGAASPSDVLSAKYEPDRGTSKLERRAWFVGLVVAALVASSVTSGGYDGLFVGGGKLADDSLVTLAADGSAISVTSISRTHSGIASMTSFSYHVPKSYTVRWVDSDGREMPYSTAPHGSHTRYDVSLPRDTERDRRIVYTQITEIPQAATQTDDVWTYASDEEYGFKQNDFTKTVLLPEGAVLVSTEPKPVLDYTLGGRLALRFQGTRGQNQKFEVKVRYRLADESSE
jgi:hypothetical protein